MPIFHQSIRPNTSQADAYTFDYVVSQQLTLDTGLTSVEVQFNPTNKTCAVGAVFLSTELAARFVSEGGVISINSVTFKGLTAIDSLAAEIKTFSDVKYLAVSQLFIADLSIVISEGND